LKNVIVLSDAADDLEKARNFYEEQEPYLGHYCVTSLLDDLDELADFSGIHSRHFGYCRMIGTHFPFGIYYREHGHDTLVVAILDLRRDPNWLRKQLSKRSRQND
jgi:plasmid stabilization system protein ParE